MKNRYLITLLLPACFIFHSCKKEFLEKNDPNSVSAGQFFNTENDVALAVNGVYQSLRSSNTIGENSGLFTDERSDDGGRNDNQSNAGEPFQFNDFSLLPSNTYLKNHWLALYETIARCNHVLSNVDEIRFSNNDLKEQYKAEVKFIRALIYFHLVRKWGDVPLVTTQLTTAGEVDAHTFREKKEKVYKQIVADLKDAVNSPLPDLQPAANRGRVSKVAANVILGQVYLTMATTLDQANRVENLNNAKNYLTEAFNKRPFGELKEIPYEDVFDVNKEATNKDAIFVIANRQGDINYSSSVAANNQAKGESINSLRPSSGVGARVTLDLVKEYENGDLRKDFSIKYANDPTVKDWFVTKFRDASAAAGTSGYGGNDWILIRYADVILMLAEVHMHLNENEEAIEYLDMVRERARMARYEVAMQDESYSSRFPDLKSAILHERRVELALEHHRWFDLLRFFTTDELVTYFYSKNQADYGNAKLSNFSKKDHYFPIPFDEYKLDPQRMYQNEGY